eukprot:3690143-Karenia_brevis.AAC.1
MVTASRLEWALEQIAAGRKVRVRLNSHAGKMIIHVHLLSEYCTDLVHAATTLLLTHVLNCLDDYVAVDHGHKHSNGESHFSIVLKTRASIPHGHRHASSDSNDDSGDNDDFGGASKRHRQSGNDDIDPWHTDHGDPWT